jgi:DNA-binding response OmpR family regulator
MSHSLRVLIVEDEVPAAMLVEDAVESAGHVVAGLATNINTAMAAASAMAFDVALLDLNLDGQKAHALPVILHKRSKPFAFVTGYGSAGVLPEFAEAPVIHKPFAREEIWSALSALGERI